MGKYDKLNPVRQVHATKRCPECFANLPLDARRCTTCNQKVGSIGKDGIAKRPINIKAYISALIATGALAYYVWWAFLRE